MRNDEHPTITVSELERRADRAAREILAGVSQVDRNFAATGEDLPSLVEPPAAVADPLPERYRALHDDLRARIVDVMVRSFDVIPDESQQGVALNG